MSVQNLSGQVLGQYELREMLGMGGMSAVYHAYQPELERHVAIKVLSPLIGAQEDYGERFILEAKTIASLEHPHIVPVYDYGTQQGISYVAMRLLTGGTLAQRLDQRLLDGNPLPSLGEIADLLRQLASALYYAHSRGVIHRDIKTGNVMFDRQGNAYLVDFGIAKLMYSSTVLTKEGIIIGTTAYMAPEQWRGDPLTPALDQYALAVLMYLLVTGHLPYSASTTHEEMYKHLHEMPAPAHTLRQDVPEAVSSVLEKALQKEPENRYPDVTAFSDAFTEAVRGWEGQPTEFFTFALAPGTTPSLLAVPEANGANTRRLGLDNVSVETVPTPVPAVYPPPIVNPPSAVYAPARVRRKSNPALPLLVGLGIGTLALVVFGVLGLFILSLFTNGQPKIPRNTNLPSVETTVDATTSQPSEAPSQPTSILTPGSVIGSIIVPVPVGQSAITPANAEQLSPLTELQREPLPVRSVAFSPDGRLLATGNGDNTIRLWNIETHQQQAVLSGHSGIVYDLAFNPDGRILASAGGDGTLRLWNTNDGGPISILYGHNGSHIRSVAFSPDGRQMASGGEDSTITFWDVVTGTTGKILTIPGERVLSVAFSPDGRLLASAGGQDGRIILWNVATGVQERVLEGHSGEVREVVFSPDGTKLASASADNTVRIWDITSGAPRLTLEHGRDVFSVAFSPDGRVLASGARDNTAHLWDANTGKALAVLQRHSGWVFSLAFNHDGSLIASGGGDGSVWLWGLG